MAAPMPGALPPRRRSRGLIWWLVLVALAVFVVGRLRPALALVPAVGLAVLWVLPAVLVVLALLVAFSTGRRGSRP